MWLNKNRPSSQHKKVVYMSHNQASLNIKLEMVVTEEVFLLKLEICKMCLII